MKKFILLLKIILPLIILYFIFIKLDPAEIRAAFEKANNWYILLAGIMIVPNILLQALRWRLFIHLESKNATLWEAVKSILVGFSFGLITPGQSGDVARIITIKAPDRLRLLGWAVLDKAYSQIPVIILGLFAYLYYLTAYVKISYYISIPLGILFFIVLTLLSALALSPKMLRSLFYVISIILPYREKIKGAVDHLDRFPQDKAQQVYMYSIIFFATYVTQFFILASAFERIPLLAGFAAIICMNFTKSLLPVSLGDLGIREGASIYFFTAMGMTEIAALNAALLLFVINVLIPSLAGLLFIPSVKIIKNMDSHD